MIGTLYREELRATMRGRFAWLGAAVVLLAVGGLAAAATQDDWLDGYGLIAYFLVPLAFIPFAAVAIASPRANRFVESVFTAPVARRDWLVAKVLVLLTLAAGYYVALLPMMLVYVHHVGFPLLLQRLLLWAPGLLISGVAIGTLVGVLFIGRSIAAPAATAMGLLLAYAGFVPLQELLVSQGNGATHSGRLTLASPAVLLKNGFGFALAIGTIPTVTLWTWISLGILVAGAFALAAWVFLRAQGVETWETTRSQRWAIALALVAIAFFPVAFADHQYDQPAPAHTAAPAIRGLFARGNGRLAVTAPGGPLPARCCSTILNRFDAPLGTDESTRQDLLILLPVDTSRRVTDLDVTVTGDAGLHTTVDPDAVAAAASHLERRTYRNGLGPPAPDGSRIATGWVVRVPVTFTPTHPWDIGGDRYPLRVTATYRVDGDAALETLNERGAVGAQVPQGMSEMAAAGAVFPLICLVAAITRWRRTR